MKFHWRIVDLGSSRERSRKLLSDSYRGIYCKHQGQHQQAPSCTAASAWNAVAIPVALQLPRAPCCWAGWRCRGGGSAHGRRAQPERAAVTTHNFQRNSCICPPWVSCRETTMPISNVGTESAGKVGDGLKAQVCQRLRVCFEYILLKISCILLLAVFLYLKQMTPSQFNMKYLLGKILCSCFAIRLSFPYPALGSINSY